MKTPQNFSLSLKENRKLVKALLPSEDILSYDFATQDKVDCTLFYADGVVNKDLLGRLVATPLSFTELKKAKAGGKVALSVDKALENIRFPELKTVETVAESV